MPFDAFCRGDSPVKTAVRYRRSSLPSAWISLLQALNPIPHQSRDQRDHYKNVNHDPLYMDSNHTSLIWPHAEPFASRHVTHYKRPPGMEIEHGNLTHRVQRVWGRVAAYLMYWMNASC
jgi:hypothetical protein